MILAATVNIQPEHVIFISSFIIATGYIVSKLRKIGHAVDRWEQIPQALTDITIIKDEVVDPYARPGAPKLYQRVALLEGTLTDHTDRDTENFHSIDGRFTRVDDALHIKPMEDDDA